jgi:mannose-6-phosphate isomerase-like protein (cupin superfamily)
VRTGALARPSRAQLGSLFSRQRIFLRPASEMRHPLTAQHHVTAQQRANEDSMSKVNIAEKFANITEYYKPRIAAELNGQQVKFVKLNSEFVFHHHENEDEMFLVVKGRFRMDFRDRHEWIDEGEFIVVPRRVEHRPVAEQECWIVLFEPATTLNTGNVENERTVHELERV